MLAFIQFVVAELGLGMSLLLLFFGILLIWKIVDRIFLRKSEKQERERKARQEKKKDE